MPKARLAFALVFWGSALVALTKCGSSAVTPPVHTSSTTGDDGGAPIKINTDSGPPDAGQSALTISPANLTFATVGCGKTSDPQNVSIQNTGSSTSHIVATVLDGTAFAATLAPAGTPDAGTGNTVDLSPGQFATLRVVAHVPASPGTHMSGYTDTVQLSVTPAPAATTNLKIPLTVTPKGAVLDWVPHGYNFQGVPLQTSAQSSFTVKNTGNDTANVSFTVDNALFALSSLGPLQIAGGTSSAADNVTFSPIDTTTQSGSVDMSVDQTTTLCAPLPPAFTLQGHGSAGQALVQPTQILFGPNSDGFVPCNSQATAQPVTIQNTGTAAFTFTASFSQGGGNFSLTGVPAQPIVQAGSSTTIYVQPKPIPGTSAVTTDLYSGILEILTNAPNDTPHIIQLHQTAAGAILTSTYGGQTLAFGTVPVGLSTQTSFSLRNGGNVPAEVSFADGNPTVFVVSPASQTTVPAGGSISPSVQFVPANTQPYTDTATMTASVAQGQVFCQPLPGSITLTGTGGAAPPLGLTVSQTSLDFGQVACGSSVTGISFNINNTGSLPFTWTSSLRNGASSLFTLTPSSGQINAGSFQPVTLTMNPVPNPGTTAVDGYGDLLTLQASTALGHSSLNVPVHLTGKGAILRFSPTGLAFGNVPRGTTSPTVPFSIVNDGNTAAEVDLAVANGAGSTSTVQRAPLGFITINGGASAALTSTFTANDTNPQTSTITMSNAQGSSNVFCQPIPSPISVTGTGTTGSVGVAPSALYFGSVPGDGHVPCGGTGTTQTITLTNTGNASFNWTATFNTGAAFYTVSPTSGTVPAQVGTTPGTQTVQIVPKAIPTTSAVTTDLYGGTLNITTNVSGDAAHLIPLHQTAKGAILVSTLAGQTFGFGNETVNQSAVTQFSVTNNGNDAADFSFQNGSNAFSISGASTVAAQQSVSPTITFLPTAVQSYSDTAVMKYSASTTTLCAALPANIGLTGKGVAAAPPVMAASLSTVDYSQVPCGAVNQIKSFAVQNNGTNPYTLTGTFRNGANSIFSFSSPPSSPTVVGAGSQVNVQITIPKMPQSASVAPNFFADTLTLQATNTGGSQIINIPITITAKGAIMRFSPTIVDFGIVPLGGSPTVPFSVVNDGNATAEVNFAVASDNTAISAKFGRSPTGTVTVSGGTTNSTLSATFSASDTSLTTSASQSGRVTMLDSGNASNVFCAPLPSPLSLTATEANITTSVSTAQLDFGSTSCGAQATPQSITITNLASGGSAITWNASITSGSSFYTLSASTGSIPPSGQVSFQVQPKPIPQTSAVTPNLYSGTLSITTNAPNDTGHIVQLLQSAQGVILQSTAGSSIAFGGQSVNQTSTHQFSLTNVGNVPVSGLQLSNSNPVFAVNAGSANPQLLTFDLQPNQTQVPVISFTPSSVTSFSDTLILAVPGGTVLCGTAPGNVQLTGSGVTGVTVSVSNLNFGLVQGQSTPPAGQTITITNKGSALNWTPTLGRGQQNLSPYYALSDSQGNAIATGTPQSLGAGSSATFIVTPVQILTPASTSSDAFADTLTITTDAAGDAAHVIQLHMTAQGAFLTVAPTPIDVGFIGSGTTHFTTINVANSGNYQASYTLGVTLQSGNNKVNTTYPQSPSVCTAYTSSSPWVNQCAPPTSSCVDSLSNTINISNPEFCSTLAGGSIYSGQTQSGILESTGYPVNSLGGNPPQALGFLTITPAAGSVLCSDPVPSVPLSSNP